jgi:hypothetical protein
MQQPGAFVPPAIPLQGTGVPATTAKDESDLNLLATLHYVWSGLLGCGTVGIFGYFVLVAGALGLGASKGGAPGGEVAAAVGVTTVMGIVVTLMFLALFVIHILAASGLKKRKRRVLTYIASALMCTSVPLGTLLGIFTIITLGRPGVRALYNE